jgi:hypothetical protein
MAKPTKEEVANAVEEITTSKYTKEELLAIFDSILFEGEYREEFKIKGKLAVTFRTRTADETSFITNEVDTKSFNLVSSLQEYRALLNIASSLVIYNTKDLSSLSLDERRAFVGKLPSVVAAAISNSLVEFDQKTDAALREGEENF